MNLKRISPLILNELKQTASQSPDPSTKCAAILCEGERIISRGFNRPFPEVSDTDIGKLSNRNYKINIMEHAECNCIRNIPVEFSRNCCNENHVLQLTKIQQIHSSTFMYITSTPCLHCAIQIMKAGIRHVGIVDHNPDFTNESWGMLWKDAIEYLDKNGAEIIYYDRSGRVISRVEEGTIVPCSRN